MKGSAIGIVAAGCLVVGFGAGFVARPMISPGGLSAAAVAGVARLAADTPALADLESRESRVSVLDADAGAIREFVARHALR